jgi:hypothetical protein
VKISSILLGFIAISGVKQKEEEVSQKQIVSNVERLLQKNRQKTQNHFFLGFAFCLSLSINKVYHVFGRISVLGEASSKTPQTKFEKNKSRGGGGERMHDAWFMCLFGELAQQGAGVCIYAYVRRFLVFCSYLYCHLSPGPASRVFSRLSAFGCRLSPSKTARHLVTRTPPRPDVPCAVLGTPLLSSSRHRLCPLVSCYKAPAPLLPTRSQI